jgi:hypothetical protein
MYRRAKWIATAAAAVAVIGFGATSALGAGAGTETFTEHAHEVTFIDEPKTNPCTGEAGTLLAVARNFIFHVTTQADGNSWVTGTGNGEVTFTPTEPGGVSYSGHFTQWFGESKNNKNEVGHDTGTFALKGTDGSTVHVHILDHFSTNAKGEVKVETQVKEVRCG